MLSQAILRGEGEEEEKRNGDMNFHSISHFLCC